MAIRPGRRSWGGPSELLATSYAAKSSLVAGDISQELRADVAGRAGHRCEYCLIHQNDASFPHQVDPIVSRKHGGLSSPENLA
jgi:hypothetical protein